MHRLVQVQEALEQASGAAVSLRDLQTLAAIACARDEYSRADLEAVFAVTLEELFADSPAALVQPGERQ